MRNVITPFKYMKIGDVTPRGWLYTQMMREIDGISGHLDEICDNVGSDAFGCNRTSAMDGFNWWNAESEGNWIDGLTRLAYTVGDTWAKEKVDKYMQHILDTVESDGYIGAYSSEWKYVYKENDGELWAQSRILLAMLAYYDATENSKILDAVKKASLLTVHQYGPLAGGHTYFNRKGQKGGMGHGLMIVEPMLWLYEITGDERFRDFAIFCYDDYSSNIDMILTAADCQLHNLLDEHKPFIGHGPHTTENLRIPLMIYNCTGDEKYLKAFKNAIEKVKVVIGLSGACRSDEEVGFPLPTAGNEYCAITELFLSLSMGMTLLGDSELAEMAEYLFMNGAQANRHCDGKTAAYCSADNITHADNEPNERWDYSPTHEEVAVCCTPNVVRITPYFVNRMWLETADGGLYANLYGPCSVKTIIDKVKVTIEENTNYPFNDTINIVINVSEPVRFPLKLRIPKWAKEMIVKVDGFDVKVSRDENCYTIEACWNGEMQVDISFITGNSTMKAVDNTIGIRRGPLLYAYRIPETAYYTKNYLLPGFHDTNYIPVEGACWDYTLLIDRESLDKVFMYESSNVADDIFPWEQSPVRIKVKALDWTGAPKDIEFVPIGTTILRITVFKYLESSVSLCGAYTERDVSLELFRRPSKNEYE